MAHVADFNGGAVWEAFGLAGFLVAGLPTRTCLASRFLEEAVVRLFTYKEARHVRLDTTRPSSKLHN